STMRVVAIVSALLLLAVRASSQLCVPDCTGRKEGDLVKNPTNCLQYYVCSDPDGDGVLPIEPSVLPLQCEEGYFFNSAESVRQCQTINPSADYCKGLCSPCVIQCETPGTLIPSTLDCSKYEICLETGPQEVECPTATPYFNFENYGCTDDPTVCYDLCDPCDVYCVAEGRIPNPHNCHGYLYCNPPDVALFLCPENEVFNTQSLICENTTDTCDNLCTDTTGAYDGSLGAFLE
ncbi:hypothetical protein OTU49_011198, partial [Cherax quadricarinatus]